jgi:ferredoxin--NADP+ reductase
LGTTLRLAIVGAGPAGIYAADIAKRAEAEHGLDVSIDLFERLPAPYGLVRYGVAPDHPRIKGIISALREVLDRGAVRLFGNVDFGTDITLDDLARHYHAVIFATGAIRDAELDIPGIDLPGSYGAADLVSWYDGHPDVDRTWPLDAREVAVIGNGNVALDIARMLVKPLPDLLTTELPPNVAEVLERSPITDVHVFGRRGPAQVKFTPLELRELGEVRDVDMVVADEDFEYDDAARQAIASNKQVLVLDRVFQSWRKREVGSASRRLTFHFWARPVEVLGETRVEGIRWERMESDGTGGARGTGEYREVPVQAVYRAVGYFGSPLAGVPFDERTGVIPNVEGRVVDERGAVVPGLYATGWIKRGPVGLIGHTKSDAMETVRHVLEDGALWWRPAEPDEDAVVELLESRGIRYTTVEGWRLLDEHEIALGAPEGRARIKVVSRDDMLAASLGAPTH